MRVRTVFTIEKNDKDPSMMNRRILTQSAAALAVGTWLSWAPAVLAADEAPDALIKRLSADVLETVKSDKSIKAGEVDKIMVLVNKSILPHVNFRRMTAAAVGPAWRRATPEQQQRLQDEFKTLLVRTEIRGRGDPVQLDYRLEKTPGEGSGWKIYNLNVLGVWLVETYRTQFAQEINANGLDGLIEALAARNKANAGGNTGVAGAK